MSSLWDFSESEGLDVGIPGFLEDAMEFAKNFGLKKLREVDITSIIRPVVFSSSPRFLLEERGIYWRHVNGQGLVGFHRGTPVTNGCNTTEEVICLLGKYLRGRKFSPDLRLLVDFIRGEYLINGIGGDGFGNGTDIFEILGQPITYSGLGVCDALGLLYSYYDGKTDSLPLAEVSVKDALRKLDECRHERKKRPQRDRESKNAIGYIGSANNTVAKFFHKSDTCKNVLHLGSGGLNCLSQYAFPGSSVHCVDPVLGNGGVEDLSPDFVAQFDCVVSDMAVYSDRGGLTKETNDLVEKLLSMTTETQHIIVKVCLAEDYGPELSGRLWKARFKNRIHNLEMVLERSQRGRHIDFLSMRAAQVVYHGNEIRQLIYSRGWRKTEVFGEPFRFEWFFPQFYVDMGKLKGKYGFSKILKVLTEGNSDISVDEVWFYIDRYGLDYLLKKLKLK